MSDIKELIVAITETAREIDGKKRLPCRMAIELAEKFNVSNDTVGRACNDSNIKITNCQLGCFK